MKKILIRPTFSLRPYVAHYWMWELSGKKTYFPDIIPGTGVELLFVYGGALLVKSEDGVLSNAGLGIILCPRKKRLSFMPSGKVKIISVRFRSTGFYGLFGIPLTEFSDKIIPAEHILNITSFAKWNFAESISDKITLLENFLLQKLRTVDYSNSAMNWAVDVLYYKNLIYGVKDIREQLKTSERTFQRRFKRITGVDAKYFEKTARFQYTLRRLLSSCSSDYFDVALKQGYYDQSHFIRDFRFFTGVSLRKYLINKNFSINFYNNDIYKETMISNQG